MSDNICIHSHNIKRNIYALDIYMYIHISSNDDMIS